MLDYIKKLLRATAVSDDKNSVRNPMVGEPSFGDEVFSKLSKEKRSEEHLVLLKVKAIALVQL